MFLIFCDHKDTEFDSRGMEIGISGQILTDKKVNGSMGQQYLYSNRRKKHMVVILHIYVARAISEY